MDNTNKGTNFPNKFLQTIIYHSLLYVKREVLCYSKSNFKNINLRRISLKYNDYNIINYFFSFIIYLF